jgi:chromosome segregation ATPase
MVVVMKTSNKKISDDLGPLFCYLPAMTDKAKLDDLNSKISALDTELKTLRAERRELRESLRPANSRAEIRRREKQLAERAREMASAAMPPFPNADNAPAILQWVREYGALETTAREELLISLQKSSDS